VADVIVECRQLACGYEGQPVLRGIDLEVRRGEILALLGGSGSGKSTVLRTLTGLMPPLAGEVLLFGQPLHRLEVGAQRTLLRRTGLVFQQDALFGSMNLLDNLATPLRELTSLPEEVIGEMARMRLALVGLAGLAHRLPSALSGGQRKRAALARASILDPELIFCDEPTAGLDPVMAAEIEHALLYLRDVLGATIVAVTHELATVRAIADRVVMLSGGTIRASGTLEQLAAREEPDLRQFFHRQRATSSQSADRLEDLIHGAPP
jgi:phospholipid/cholesterol/gamma-HCH transport system ATP-binding protein